MARSNPLNKESQATNSLQPAAASPCGACRCSSRTHCCAPMATMCPIRLALYCGNGGQGCAVLLLDGANWRGASQKHIKTLHLIAGHAGMDTRQPSHSKALSHSMHGAEVCNIVGANHHRESLGVEPPGPLPILQPPQQVHSLVARDACHKRPVKTKWAGRGLMEQWLSAAGLPWVSLSSICRGLKRQPEQKKRTEAGRLQRDSVPHSQPERQAAAAAHQPPLRPVHTPPHS